MNNDPTKLNLPEGVSPQGPVMDLGEAYLKAMISLPEILLRIENHLSEIAACQDTICLFCERKGIKEELFGPEEIEIPEDDKGEGLDGKTLSGN